VILLKFLGSINKVADIDTRQRSKQQRRKLYTEPDFFDQIRQLQEKIDNLQKNKEEVPIIQQWKDQLSEENLEKIIQQRLKERQEKEERDRKEKEILAKEAEDKAKKEKEAQERLEALARETEERRLKEEKERKEAEEKAQREKDEQERIALTQMLLARQRELQAQLEKETAEEERRKQLAEKARQDKLRKETEQQIARALEEQEQRERAKQDLEIAENIQRSREEADRRKAAGIHKAFEIRDQRLAEVERLAEEEKAKKKPARKPRKTPNKASWNQFYSGATRMGQLMQSAPISIPDSPPTVASNPIELEAPTPQTTVTKITESVTIRPQAVASGPPPPPIPPQQPRGPESAIPAQIIHISPDAQLILQQMAMMARSIDNGQKEIIKLLKEQKESKLAKRKREDEAVKGEENFKKKLIDFISNNK
jgi:hypothetical protein